MMTAWQYLHDVCGVENFISRDVPVVVPAPEEAPVTAQSPKIIFLTAESAEAFQQKYSALFDKMMLAMGLSPEMYQMIFEQKSFAVAQESLQIFFDSSQTLGWQTNSSYLVVSSLDELLNNVEAKRKTWFYLKEVSSHMQ